MSESKQRGDTDDRQVSSAPRAVIHKKILDVAARNPTASMTEVAGEVSGASTDLVERVLDEYGDPGSGEGDDAEADGNSNTDPTVDGSSGPPSPGSATSTAAGAGDAAESVTSTGQQVADGGSLTDGEEAGTDESTNASGEATTEDDDSSVDLDGLDDTDRELLATVARNPGATQEVVADHMGVSRATVSRRVNDIEGFDWTDRETFVDGLCDGADDPASNAEDDTAGNAEDRADVTEDRADVEEAATPDDSVETANALDDLTDRVATVESRVEAIEDDSTGDVFDDPELVHKVARACMESDRLTEDEEVRVLAALMD